MRYREHLTAAVALDRAAGTPLPRQLADQLCAAIERGALPRDTRMPSTRTLGSLLDVSRGVALAAYDLLAARGYVQGRRGSGTYVTSPVRRGGPRPARPAGPRRDLLDLTPGGGCAEALPIGAWRAAWRRAGHTPPPAGRLPALGLPELRHALAAHLLRTKGIAAPDHEIAVTAGVAQGLRLALAALGARDGVAVEDPAPAEWRRAIRDAACLTVPVPVDADGLRVAALPDGCRAVVLSADAHVPLGHALSTPRRAAVLDWARATGGAVVEVACDAVPRPAASHLPRLLDGPGADSVALVGGLADLLPPAVGLGYAVVPRRLVPAVAARLRDDPARPEYVTQLAVASLLRDGGVILGRAERAHAARRAVVLAALGATSLSAVDGVGTVGLPLPSGTDAREVAAWLRGRGLAVRTLAEYHASPRAAPSALVVGYTRLGEGALAEAMAALVSALASRGWTRVSAPTPG